MIFPWVGRTESCTYHNSVADVVRFSTCEDDPSNRTPHELLLIEVGKDSAAIPAGRRVGMYHFGLKVGDTDDELRAALATLKEHNVPVVGASDHTVTHSLYILDPDGNEVELYIDVAGVDWKSDPSLAMAGIKPLVL